MWRGTVMWNVAGNGGVGMLQRTEMWNMVENFDVECSRERLREIWWRTVVWNVVENGDVMAQRVIL